MKSTRWITGLLLGGLCISLAACARPQSHRSQPEQLIHQGWNFFRLGEFNQARKDFQKALEHAPRGSTPQLQALYGLATTWSLQRPDEDPVRAAQYYRQLIDLAPTHDLAAWSLLALARMQMLPVAGEPPPWQAQAAAYQPVIDRFAFHPAGEEAFIFLQAAKLRDQPDEAQTREILQALDAFLHAHPQSPWRTTACTLAVHCHTLLDEGESRLADIIQAWKTAELDPLNPIQDCSATYWQIATTAEFDAGDFTVARQYYRQLIAEYPTDQRVFLAQQELKRMDDLESIIQREQNTAPAQ